MLNDCCWSLITKTPTGENKNQKMRKWVFNELFSG
jgi:hypothetical protein